MERKSSIIVKGINYWNGIKRKQWLNRLHKQNRNHDFCLITNDCIGGVIYHDLGEQFRSPTVNLWIPNDCYFEFARDLKYYLSCEIKQTPNASTSYPIGTIIPKDDQHIPVTVHFVHYRTFKEAYAKWKERSARVNYDKLYFIWHFFGDDHIEKIQAFDRWDVRKLTILHEPVESIQKCEVVSCYNETPYNGKILSVIDKTGRRYLDEVNYIGFLNQGEDRSC